MPIEQFKLSHMNGRQFEDLVEQLVKRMGFIVEERKLTADGGVDVLATSYEPIFKGKYVIQCKRYTHKVGESIVRDLYGVVHSRNANKGILITNSTFTKKAIDFARNKQLELVDGEKLRSLLVKYEITKPKKRTVVLPNYALFLGNSFVPALNKIREHVEDIKNGRVYMDKRIYSNKQLYDLHRANIDRLGDYANFVASIVNSWGSTFIEKEPDMQQLKNDCGKVIDATKKLVNDYKSLLSVIPPPKLHASFLKIHEKFIACYPSVFETIFRFADEIEKATTDPKPQIYRFILTFPDKDLQELSKAIKEAKEIMRTQRQKSWWQ